MTLLLQVSYVRVKLSMLRIFPVSSLGVALFSIAYPVLQGVHQGTWSVNHSEQTGFLLSFIQINHRTHVVKTTKQITIMQLKTRLKELQAKIQIKEGEKANQYVQEKLTSDPALKRY